MANKENEMPNKVLSDEEYKSNTNDGSKMVTSTPSAHATKHRKETDFFNDKKDLVRPDLFDSNEFPQGSFFGFGRHKDDSEINIMYQVGIFRSCRNINQCRRC